MTHCEHLQAALDKAIEAGNEQAAAAISLAMQASGCAITANSGGTGNGPPVKP